MSGNRDPLLPHGEGLRRALRWLSEHAPISAASINQACVRFDLTPQEEEFLLREFLQHSPDTTGEGDNGQ